MREQQRIDHFVDKILGLIDDFFHGYCLLEARFFPVDPAMI
jgi:hypothetical protein